jgi:hypothetical protein
MDDSFDHLFEDLSVNNQSIVKPARKQRAVSKKNKKASTSDDSIQNVIDSVVPTA